MIRIKNKKLLYPELSYKITGVLFRVHNRFGRYMREKQYQDGIAEELKKRGVGV